MFRARDTHLDREVALKVILADTSADVLAEARAAVRVSHPSVVQVHAVEEVGDLAFVVMELVAGVSLAVLKPAQDPSGSTWLHMLDGLIEAVASLHAAGVVHRDIKPANLMLAAEGRLRIVDFGIALAPGRETVSGGTPGYMAPEQWGGVGDARSDVYSLGVVVTELLTGQRPDAGRLDKEQARALRRLGVERLAPVLERACAPNPADRPASASVLLEAYRDAVRRSRRARTLRRAALLAAVAFAVVIAAFVFVPSDPQMAPRVPTLAWRSVSSNGLGPLVTAAAIDSTGTRLGVVYSNGSVRVQALTDDESSNGREVLRGGAESIAWLSDEELAVARRDGYAVVNVGTGAVTVEGDGLVDAVTWSRFGPVTLDKRGLVLNGRRLPVSADSPDGQLVPALATSPDGREVAFQRADAGTHVATVWVVDLASGATRPLSGLANVAPGLAWTTRGLLVIETNRANAGSQIERLYRVDPLGVARPVELSVWNDHTHRVLAANVPGDVIAVVESRTRWTTELIVPGELTRWVVGGQTRVSDVDEDQILLTATQWWGHDIVSVPRADLVGGVEALLPQASISDESTSYSHPTVSSAGRIFAFRTPHTSQAGADADASQLVFGRPPALRSIAEVGAHLAQSNAPPPTWARVVCAPAARERCALVTASRGQLEVRELGEGGVGPRLLTITPATHDSHYGLAISADGERFVWPDPEGRVRWSSRDGATTGVLELPGELRPYRARFDARGHLWLLMGELDPTQREILELDAEMREARRMRPAPFTMPSYVAVAPQGDLVALSGASIERQVMVATVPR